MDVVQTGSGGLGAVSVGVSEAVVIGLIILLVLGLSLGLWKLAKVLLLALRG